jgi:hypothetical protein
MSLRFQIAALIYMMMSAVMSGFGIIVVLIKPRPANHVFWLIPAVIIASLVLAVPLAWSMARRFIVRYSRERPGADPES